MPIEGLSNIVRIPRLGKIHLGIKAKSDKAKGAEYPKATDYFVVPDEVKAVYGEKPTKLDIMFPVEEPEMFAQQWLRAYSMSQGLVCIGDGLEARRKIDVETGAIANHETNQWEWHQITCAPQECPEYQTKRCRRVMNLQFLLPNVPGLGVYQIDTSSFYSIVNINSMIKMLQGMLGRCSIVPLTLELGQIEVTPPGEKKKKVFIMHINKDIKIAELARIAQLPVARVLTPEPDTDEPPDDLFPQSVIGDGPPHRRKRLAEKAGSKDLPWKATEKESKEGKGQGDGQEDEIPQVDQKLLTGWQIARKIVQELELTDRQIRNWFAHYKLEVGLSDFAKALPRQDVTADIISNFVTMLDAYKEKKAAEKSQEILD
jgi:hypothetical protein